MSITDVMPISVPFFDHQSSTDSLASEAGLLSPRFDGSTIAHAMAVDAASQSVAEAVTASTPTVETAADLKDFEKAPSSSLSVATVVNSANALGSQTALIKGSRKWYGESQKDIVDLKIGDVDSDGNFQGTIKPSGITLPGFPTSGEFDVVGQQDMTAVLPTFPTFTLYVNWKNGTFSSITGYLNYLDALITKVITVTGRTADSIKVTDEVRFQ